MGHHRTRQERHHAVTALRILNLRLSCAEVLYGASALLRGVAVTEGLGVYEPVR